MKTVTGIEAMRTLSRRWRKGQKTAGFVPTMGYLHEGHLSLVRECKARSDVTVVSIFVNPTQFGPREDFREYPRDLERDRSLLAKEGVDVLFSPAADDMYPAGYKTYVEVHDLQDRLCGFSRVGHFRGVCTVVLKLFNIVGPQLAFFGWKDAQQVVILRKMVKDLDLGVEIVACPLVREPDGLAMSSRNTYLSPEERQAALALSRGLAAAERLIKIGERTSSRVFWAIREVLEAEPLVQIEYVEITDLEELRPLRRLGGDVLIALAATVGKTRLIDNIRVKV